MRARIGAQRPIASTAIQNVLDLALYSTRGGPKLLDKAIILFGYPGFITLAFVESLWLLWWLWSSSAPGRVAFVIIACPVLFGAAILVTRMWFQRINQVRTTPCASEPSGIGKPRQSRLDVLYLTTISLLLAHQIDSAYWHEWKLFGLPGGIQTFVSTNILLIVPFLYGLLRAQTSPRTAAKYGIALSIIGIGAFAIHAWFLILVHQDFRLPVSIAILTGALITSIGLGWQCITIVTIRTRTKD